MAKKRIIEPTDGVVPAARLVVNAFFGSSLINRDTALGFLKEAVEAHDNRIRASRRQRSRKEAA